MKKWFALLLIFLVKFSPLIAQVNGDDLLGYWITEDNNAVIHCYKLNDEYFARVVWYGPFKEETLKKMSPEERANVPTKYINALVLRDFKFENKEWNSGHIIQVFEDKTYTAFIKEISKKELKITGFIFFRWLSESTVIHRCEKPDGKTHPKAI